MRGAERKRVEGVEGHFGRGICGGGAGRNSHDILRYRLLNQNVFLVSVEREQSCVIAFVGASVKVTLAASWCTGQQHKSGTFRNEHGAYSSGER